MIKIGLKANAVFLFGQMNGDILGGTGGGVYWNKVLHVTKEQFKKFKALIVTYGGDLNKSLTKIEKNSFCDKVDYECYFIKS